MREWENEKSEKMRCELELEEWGCASEIKQILNKIKAAPCKPAEIFLVYSTLPKVRAAQAVVARQAFNFAKVWNFGKVYTPKSDTTEGAKGSEDFQKEELR